MNKKDSKERLFLRELLEEDPDLLYFTEIGIILGDYMRAATMSSQNELDPASKFTAFSLCLISTIGDRYDKLDQYPQ